MLWDLGGGVHVDGRAGPLEHRLECNPVQNAGCDSTRGESCVYDVAKDNALCGQLTARLAHEEPCSPLDNVCDRNLTCTARPSASPRSSAAASTPTSASAGSGARSGT